MEKDLISIIVPCYNTSRYLKDVFLSIQNQTYQNIEPIFVDDGSTDDTGKILDDFIKAYPKAKVIHKPNGGLSSARNAGLAIAHGKFIYFMDADDIIHPSLIENSWKLITDYRADVVTLNFVRVPNGFSYNKVSKSKINLKSILKVGEDNIFATFLAEVNLRFAWGKLFPHDLIRKMPNYPKVFDEQCFYGEDVLFNSYYFQLCKRAVWCKNKLCYYRKVKTSMMHSAFKEKELTVFKSEPVLNSLNPNIYQESLKYVPSLICFAAMNLISRLRHSDYQNPKVVNDIYHRYRDNLKCLPRLSRLTWSYRFGTLFTLPVMYLMIRKKLKG